MSPTSPTVTQYNPLTLTCATQSTNVMYVVWSKRVGSNSDLAIGTIRIRGDNDCSPPFVDFAPNSTLYTYACPATNRLTLTIRNVSRTENGVRWKCQVTVDGKPEPSQEVAITVQVGITYVMLSPTTDPINVKENTITSLQCRTSGGLPAASVRWFIQRSGQVQDVTSLSTDTYQEVDDLNVTRSTLNFTPLKADHNGQIYCSASNVGVETNSAKLSINVLYPPRLPSFTYGSNTGSVITDNNIDIIRGDGASVACEADANPAPHTYTWSGSQTNNQLLSLSSFNVNTTVLCTAFNTMTETNGSPINRSNSSTLHINVWRPPHGVTLRYHYGITGSLSIVEELKVLTSEDFWLSCTAESSPPSTYTWSSHPSSRAGILNVTGGLTASQSVSCMAENYMHTTYKGTVRGNTSSALNIDVLYGPTASNLQNVSKVRGENLVYMCLFTPGNPSTVDFEWTRSATGVPWVKQNAQNLIIPTVQRSDEASYTCKVSSLLQPTLTSATTTQYDTATFFLDILYGAENLVFQLNNASHASVEVDEHSSNYMRCFLESDPGSNMALTKDGKTIYAQPGVHQLSHELQAECSDTGLFTCSGHNQYGAADNASMQLFVKCSARRPTGVEVQLNFTARQHENATLVYKTVAYPVPKPSQFVWKRCTNRTSCEPLTDEKKKFEIDTEGLLSKLTILVVQIEDYRLYQLSVSNGIGDTLVEWLHLIPIGKPDSPTDFHVIQDILRETSAVLTWIPGFANGSPQDFHISYGKLVDGTGFYPQTIKHDNRVTMYYIVEDLKPETEYFVSLFSANEEGSSAPVNVTFLTLKRINDHTETSPNSGPVVGGAVGGTVGAIVAIVVVVIILRRNYALNCNVTLTKKRGPSEHSISGKDNPGCNAAKTYEVVSMTTKTSAYDDLKTGDSGSDNSHVYTSLEESKSKPHVYYENVKKDDPIYKNTVLKNPVQTVL
ncbi:nephrin-like isoform X2 [Mya arenaria]|nr:nephrin-like isoform X2 [Mya arenaria]